MKISKEKIMYYSKQIIEYQKPDYKEKWESFLDYHNDIIWKETTNMDEMNWTAYLLSLVIKEFNKNNHIIEES